MGVIYLDSCIVIYDVEQNPVWSPIVLAAMAKVTSPLAISPLVKAECLVRPIRDGAIDLERVCLAAFGRLVTLDMPEPVFLEAARLRARHKLKMPDALHLACAVHHGCSSFWTGDGRLAAAGGALVRTLSP